MSGSRAGEWTGGKNIIRGTPVDDDPGQKIVWRLLQEERGTNPISTWGGGGSKSGQRGYIIHNLRDLAKSKTLPHGELQTMALNYVLYFSLSHPKVRYADDTFWHRASGSWRTGRAKTNHINALLKNTKTFLAAHQPTAVPVKTSFKATQNNKCF